MTTTRIGAATITRIEETYGLFFEARTFFADWRDEIVAEHLPWMVPDHFDPASGFLKLSIHSWLVEIGGRKILIDTCIGNHKSRKARPFWDQLDTPYLARLAAAGVKPEEIDMVMNIPALKNGEKEVFFRDIQGVVRAADIVAGLSRQTARECFKIANVFIKNHRSTAGSSSDQARCLDIGPKWISN